VTFRIEIFNTSVAKESKYDKTAIKLPEKLSNNDVEERSLYWENPKTA